MEPQAGSEDRTFPGSVTIGEKDSALEMARGWRNGGTIWTDASRADSGRVGAACARKTASGWTGRGFHLGDNKEVFDAEAFAIYLVLRTFEARREAGRRYRFSLTASTLSGWP